MPGQGSEYRQARLAKCSRPLCVKNGQISLHVMPDAHKNTDFLDMTGIRV